MHTVDPFPCLYHPLIITGNGFILNPEPRRLKVRSKRKFQNLSMKVEKVKIIKGTRVQFINVWQ